MDLTEMYFARRPPTDATVDALHQVQNQATGAAAATFNWTTALAGLEGIKGQLYLLVQAQTTIAVVRFKQTGAAGTTLTNGVVVPVGVPMVFAVDPIKHQLIDVISTGAGTMQVQVVSHIFNRSNQ